MLKNLTVLLASLSIAFASLKEALIHSEAAPNARQLWFIHQLRDHFTPLANSTWSQRYWAYEDYFDPEVGPIFLYICGEYTCSGVPETRQFPIQLAKEYKGLVLVLEHRYYGNSQPFGKDSFQTDYMSLLTVNQALADLAYFMQYVVSHGWHKSTPYNPWITIGGSYPGAMSAWFRYKYPHMTVGSLASSAVVNAIRDYWQFDDQIRNSTFRSGEWCPKMIHDLNDLAQDHMKAGADQAKQFKQLFNATELKAGEFLFFFADIFVELVQYGNRTDLCNMFKGKTLNDSLTEVVDFAQKNHISPKEYGSFYLKNTTYTKDNVGSRQWTYQYCSEFGWLQTAPEHYNNSMRGDWVNITMYEQFCSDSFPDSQHKMWPNVDNTNLYLGGLDLNVENLIMTNGVEDPWKTASLLESQGDVIAYVSDCDDCAHCQELSTEREDDPEELKKARELIRDHFTEWMAQHWVKIDKPEVAKNLLKLVQQRKEKAGFLQ